MKRVEEEVTSSGITVHKKIADMSKQMNAWQDDTTTAEEEIRKKLDDLEKKQQQQEQVQKTSMSQRPYTPYSDSGGEPLPAQATHSQGSTRVCE